MTSTTNVSFAIEHTDGETKGSYTVELSGTTAEMTYSKAGDAMLIIDSTAVPDAMRGLSVGAALVKKAVEDARVSGKKIMPLCPFAKAQFQRHAEWRDVLA